LPQPHVGGVDAGEDLPDERRAGGDRQGDTGHRIPQIVDAEGGGHECEPDQASDRKPGSQVWRGVQLHDHAHAKSRHQVQHQGAAVDLCRMPLLDVVVRQA